MKSRFNYQAFTMAFLNKSTKTKLTLKELSKEIGISAPTISRLHYGKKLDIDSILAVCKWMNKDIGDFVK